jgi:hypothetical protein
MGEYSYLAAMALFLGLLVGGFVLYKRHQRGQLWPSRDRRQPRPPRRTADRDEPPKAAQGAAR